MVMALMRHLAGNFMCEFLCRRGALNYNRTKGTGKKGRGEERAERKGI